MKITAPGQSALLLVDIIKVLNKKKISYAIIGAFAASFYGVIRTSLDADAVVSLLTSQDVADLCGYLKSQGYKVIIRRGDMDDPIASVINIEDRLSNRVDLLMGIRGMGKEVFGRVQKVKFMGALIRIVSLEDFIAMKIFAGSSVDMHDATGVLRMPGQKIDLKLLRKLSAGYGTDCLRKLKVILSEDTGRKI